MPLYECHCLPCDLTFEVLAPVSDAGKGHECPDCGRLARRIVSPFAIVSGASGHKQEQQSPTRARVPRDQRPLCLQYPHLPLLCHMDDTAAKRWIAYSQGSGTEYDDKLAKREEVRKQRGETPPPEPASRGHGHAHNFRRHRKQATPETHTPDHSHAADAHDAAHPHPHHEPHGHPHHPSGHAHDH